jgi:hypothetical protein
MHCGPGPLDTVPPAARRGKAGKYVGVAEKLRPVDPDPGPSLRNLIVRSRSEVVEQSAAVCARWQAWESGDTPDRCDERSVRLVRAADYNPDTDELGLP